MSNKMDYRNFWPIALVLLLSQGVSLFNQGIYWDDWTVFLKPLEYIKIPFRGIGAPHSAYLHSWVESFSKPVFLYRVLTLIFALLSAFLLWLISVQYGTKKVIAIVFLVLLVSVSLPLYSARNTLICFRYSFSILLFILGFYSHIRGVLSQKVLLRVIAMPLYILSFTTNSLVFFLLLPFFITIYLTKDFYIGGFRDLKVLVSSRRILQSTWEYILLPFVFIILRYYYFHTTSVYESSGYNGISLGRLVSVVPDLIRTVVHNIIRLPAECINLISQDTFSLLLFTFILAFLWWFLRRFILSIDFSPLQTKKLAYLGVIVFLLGAIPYALVHKVPSFIGYSSRHQLLLFPGISVLVISGVLYLLNGKKRTTILIALIAIFSTTSLLQHVHYIRAAIKQDSIIEHFKTGIIKDKKHLLVLNKAEQYDIGLGDITFYAYHHLALAAKVPKGILLYESDDIDEVKDAYARGDIDQNIVLGIHSDIKNPLDGILTIRLGKLQLSTYSTLRLACKKVLDSSAYDSEVLDVLAIQVNSPSHTLEHYLESEYVILK